MKNFPSYYAIIPATVRYDKRLSANAKLLYGEITALCGKGGYCWARNSYFAELYGVNKISISRMIKQLIDYGYIFSEIKYREGSKEIERRYLKLRPEPLEEEVEDKIEDENLRKTEGPMLIGINNNVNTPINKNVNTPINKNVKDNNTSINNTSIIKERKEEETDLLTQEDTDLLAQEDTDLLAQEDTDLLARKDKKKSSTGNTSTIKTFNKLIESYTENIKLQEELKEHLKVRKIKKATLTDRAIELSLKKLSDLTNDDKEKILIVQNSIMNGWTTFYPLKSDEKKQLNNKASYDINKYLEVMDTFAEKELPGATYL